MKCAFRKEKRGYVEKNNDTHLQSNGHDYKTHLRLTIEKTVKRTGGRKLPKNAILRMTTEKKRHRGEIHNWAWTWTTCSHPGSIDFYRKRGTEKQ